MRQDLDDIARNGVTAEELDKVKKYELKTYERQPAAERLLQNAAKETVEWENDPVTGFKETVEAITLRRRAGLCCAMWYLKQGNCVTVTMLPATK